MGKKRKVVESAPNSFIKECKAIHGRKIDAAHVHDVIKHQAAFAAQLRDVFTPLCEVTATAALKYDAKDPDAIVMETPIYEAPYFHELLTNGRLVSLMRNEKVDRPKIIRIDHHGYDSEKAALEAMKLIEEGPIGAYFESLDSEGKQKFSDFAWIVSLNAGGISDLGNKSGSVAEKFKNFNLKGYKRCYWNRAETLSGRLRDAGTFIRVPVTEYGADFSKRIFEAIQILLKISETASHDLAKDISAHHGDLLRQHTARGIDFDYLDRDVPRALSTLQEGIVSLNSIFLMMSEKIKGADDADALLEEIIDRDLPSQLSKIIPMGFVGPLVLGGYYPANMMGRRNDGSLDFTDAFKKKMRRAKREYIAKSVIQPKPTPKVHVEHGTGCPVAVKRHIDSESGISLLAKALFHIYKERKKYSPPPFTLPQR